MKQSLQLDLFADVPPAAEAQPRRAAGSVRAEALSDEALIAALSDASLADAQNLAAEAGRRRLGAAVGALAALCHRFAGFGFDRRVPEQIAALEALAAIGGPEASRAVGRILVRRIAQGPNLAAAVVAAAALGATLPPEVALPLLRHDDPLVRAAACDCARAGGDVVPTLIALLADRRDEVATAAACALGRLGHVEARDPLKRWLKDRPSARVIEALAGLADEEAIVRLTRLARARPDLADTIVSALDEIDQPEASAAAGRLRSWLSRPEGD